MKKKVLLILSCLFLSIGFVVAQTTKASGVVLDDAGETVPGVSVVVKGTTTGTITDGDGKFSLNVPAGNKVLVFSLLGMQKVEANAADGMKITLQPDEAKALDEVMVVAYGTAKKSAFTGSAAVINSDDISKHVTTNVANALIGSVPGLQMRGSSGAPGAGSGSINIRGIASMYAGTDPLIIVDGSPYTASLSNIPQGDVESITVLKDAASAALYGARGAAGVILVTTKKAKLQAPAISLDMKWGVNSRGIKDYDVIKDPASYYEAYYKQLYNNYYYGQGYDMTKANLSANSRMLSDLGYNVYTLPENQQLIGINGKLNPNATLGRKLTYNGADYYLQPDNWTDLSYKNAFRQEYNLSVNGATDRSSFYASVGYLDEDGIIDYSSYERITARLRADYKANKWLKLGGSAAYVHSDQTSNPNLDTSLGSTNLMYFVSSIAPIYPVYIRMVDPSGNIVIKKDEYGHDMHDYGVAASNYGLSRPFSATGNPLGTNRYDKVGTENNQLNANFNLDIDITSFLKANILSTVIWGQSNYSNYQNPYEGPKVNINGQLEKNSQASLKINNIQSLTYLKNIEKHSFDVMIGHEYYRSTTKSMQIIAQGGFTPDMQEVNAFAKIAEAHSNKSQYNVEGYFSRAQYNYADKYFASLSYRRDATSYFAKDNRWGNFWAIGGAWLISREAFLSNYKWVNMLKIKASIGQQGNDNIGAFAYTDLYSLTRSDDKTMAPTFSRKGNPIITWETTTNSNLGIEFGLWKDRLTGNIDIYNKKTTDLLFWISTPESAGYRGYYGNVGDIRNRGIELTLTGAVVRTRDIDWSISASLSHNTSKILSLPESKVGDRGGYTETSLWYEVGGPLYNSFRAKYAGVNSEGLATYWIDDNLKGATDRPGKEYSRTTTNVNEASKYALGSLLPKVSGGFSTTFRFREFDAFIAFDYQLGGKIYDRQYQSLMGPGQDASSAGSNFHVDYAKAWSPNNTSSNIPRWQYGDQYSAATSDRFLTSASYLNFQTFSIGYNMPKKLIKNVSKLRVYIAGENLGFLSARKGLDPRYSYTTTELVSVYSPMRNITGGIQLLF